MKREAVGTIDNVSDDGAQFGKGGLELRAGDLKRSNDQLT